MSAVKSLNRLFINIHYLFHLFKHLIFIVYLHLCRYVFACMILLPDICDGEKKACLNDVFHANVVDHHHLRCSPR